MADIFNVDGDVPTLKSIESTVTVLMTTVSSNKEIK